MYRLFNRLPRGLEPMADIFRRHVEEEGAFGVGGWWGLCGWEDRQRAGA